MQLIDTLLNDAHFNYPSKLELEEIVSEIYENKYYTNHGPLAAQFEARVSEYLEVQNSIAVTNPFLALTMSLVALEVQGSVIVPSFCPDGIVEAIIWSGSTPVFCDIEKDSCHLNIESISKVIREDTKVILAVSLWGGVCEFEEIFTAYRDLGIEVIHFADNSFGVSKNECKVGKSLITTIFSFEYTKFLNCFNGGIVVSNNELFSRKLRNIRSSYGAGPYEKVPITANGRFSEFQAALGLWSLNKRELFRKKNKLVFGEVNKRLERSNVISVFESDSLVESNYHDLVIKLNEEASEIEKARFHKIKNAELSRGSAQLQYKKAVFSNYVEDQSFFGL